MRLKGKAGKTKEKKTEFQVKYEWTVVLLGEKYFILELRWSWKSYSKSMTTPVLKG